MLPTNLNNKMSDVPATTSPASVGTVVTSSQLHDIIEEREENETTVIHHVNSFAPEQQDKNIEEQQSVPDQEDTSNTLAGNNNMLLELKEEMDGEIPEVSLGSAEDILAADESRTEMNALTNSFDELSLLPPLPNNDLSFDVIRSQQIENFEAATSIQELEEQMAQDSNTAYNPLEDVLTASPEVLQGLQSPQSPVRSSSSRHRSSSFRSSTPLSPIAAPSALRDMRNNKMALEEMISNSDDMTVLSNVMDYTLDRNHDDSNNDMQFTMGDQNTSFDLSKALEIPNSTSSLAKTSSPKMTSDNSTSVPPSPKISSPKVSLKKKFSNTLLTQTNEQNNSKSNLNNMILPQAKHTHPDLVPVSRIGTRTSTSSIQSNTITINPRSSISSRTILDVKPRRSTSISNSVNTMSLENESEGTIQKIIERKPSLKKYQTQKTANTDATNISKLEAQLYNLPAVNTSSSLVSRAASVTSGSRDRSLSQTTKSNMSEFPPLGLAVTTSNGTPIEPKAMKKPPFLRRASSAILRKTSLKGNDSTTSIPQIPSSPITPLPSPLTAIDKKPYIRSALGRQLSSTSIISEVHPEAQSRNVSTPIMRTSSFSHRMKRGLTRIMSSNGSSNRLSSKLSMENLLRNSEQTKQQNINTDSSMFDLDHSVRQNSNGQFSDNSVLYMGSEYRNNDDQMRYPIGDNSNNDYFSFMKPQSDDSDYKTISVNMDVWKANIPIINVTDNNSLEMDMRVNKFDTQCSKVFCLENVSTPKAFSDNSTPISTSTGSKQSKNQASDDSQTSNENIQTMEIKDYIRFLHQQRMLEDSTFEKLEKQFLDSGWCSTSDLGSIRQKRQAVNKKWDDVINFYQSKLL
ncbi:uncharacterized protein RNJ42_03304 [Nakaseomyces bracarensis]|uniref:uncharacterized protein n=1 Tax=Nakaseomyces bracarensis TaxID=273131 RepID=UPI003871A45D